jgi:hypothetical protein
MPPVQQAPVKNPIMNPKPIEVPQPVAQPVVQPVQPKVDPAKVEAPKDPQKKKATFNNLFGIWWSIDCLFGIINWMESFILWISLLGVLFYWKIKDCDKKIDSVATKKSILEPNFPLFSNFGLQCFYLLSYQVIFLLIIWQAIAPKRVVIHKLLVLLLEREDILVDFLDFFF